MFKLGVAGAAWATVIGQFFSFALALRYAWHFRHIHLERRHFVPDFRQWLKTASLGMSNSLNQVAITFVQIVLNNSLTCYGALSVYGSEIPLAACGIVMKVNAILLAIIIGISQGSQPIIGFNYGARQYGRVREVYRLAVTCNLVVSAVGASFCSSSSRRQLSPFSAMAMRSTLNCRQVYAHLPFDGAAQRRAAAVFQFLLRDWKTAQRCAAVVNTPSVFLGAAAFNSAAVFRY